MTDLEKTERVISAAIKRYKPDFIVSIVSGGKDSAASHAVLQELGVKVDLIIHGNTRTGIPETKEFVMDYYGRMVADLVVADAGDQYESRVMRKGFYGVGRDAHNMAYRELKAAPFRKVISSLLRQRKHGVKVMLMNGARKYESENREKNLRMISRDPGAKNNIWVNPIHYWDQPQRDNYLDTRQVCINPVAKALCRSGECMCGTTQTKAEFVEAAALYPEWGNYMKDLQSRVLKKFPWGWGETMPAWFKAQKQGQGDLFMPMCVGCGKNKEDEA